MINLFNKVGVLILIVIFVTMLVSISSINEVQDSLITLEEYESIHYTMDDKLHIFITSPNNYVAPIKEAPIEHEVVEEKVEEVVVEVVKVDRKEPTPSRGGTSQGKRSLGTFQATAYCACTKCCGPNAKGITASGTQVTAGRTIATDPNVIPTGTRVYVEGYGERVAEDTGSAVKGNIIDLFFNSHSEALEFGRRQVRVYIID